jgi:hypothetical protein
MFVGLPVWPDEEYATRSACDLVREKRFRSKNKSVMRPIKT